jgi:hypothetical protein
MNYSFLEGRSREKVKDILEEGQRSQAYYRSGARKSRLLPSLPRFILILLGTLGILSVIIR